MNDAGTLPKHMLDIRELTEEAFAPYGQVIATLRTGGQGAETHNDPEASASEALHRRAGIALRGDGYQYRRRSRCADRGRPHGRGDRRAPVAGELIHAGSLDAFRRRAAA